MTYQFRKSESLADGIRRTAGEQIARALQELSSVNTDRHEAVHEARKRFKRIRAVLRLAKFPLGSVAVEENAVFRGLGRALGAARDAEALLETLDSLAKSGDSRLTGKIMSGLRKALTKRRDRIAGSDEWFREILSEVLPQLEAAGARVASWPLDAEDFNLMRDGLQRSFRLGKAAMTQACASGAEADFHEWRKRAKDHWYHATLLHRCWPDYFQGYCKTLNRLSDHLGDHHNLVMLRETLKSEQLVPEDISELLLAAIAREQARLEQEAKKLGLLVYVEKPAAFAARFESYWNTWRS